MPMLPCPCAPPNPIATMRAALPRWCGWVGYREVQVKSLAAHERMALLGVRRRLVDMRVEIDGQIRGILKTFGLVVGSGNKGAFAQRTRMLAQDHPVLSALIDKLIEVREVARSEERR